jgi:hypothetical protein
VLNLSRHIGNIGWSGQLGYGVNPQARIDNLALAADKRLGQDYLLNLGLPSFRPWPAVLGRAS